MLDIGSIAPTFSLADQDGKNRSLAEFKGQWVLIYFYPKDDTPGCTKEACTIAEVYDDFNKQRIAVLGVSKDSPQSHKKFAEKYRLPFTLLSDQKGDMIEAYGAWGEKSMFGRRFMGIRRISYLIDGEGKVVRVYPEVDPASHALQILNDVKSLAG
ncbi:MAG TPA: thioredoxin-dependent thiol peroxidase [Candidatus Paceibacterota bacterium]